MAVQLNQKREVHKMYVLRNEAFQIRRRSGEIFFIFYRSTKWQFGFERIFVWFLPVSNMYKIISNRLSLSLIIDSSLLALSNWSVLIWLHSANITEKDSTVFFMSLFSLKFWLCTIFKTFSLIVFYILNHQTDECFPLRRSVKL